MHITYTPRKVVYFLGAIICLLILAHTAGLIAVHYFEHTSSFYIIEYFRLAADTNFPTFFSSAQLLLCAVILAVISNIKKNQGAVDFWYWLGLSLIMLFLSIDESIMIHELIAEKLRETLNTTGVFYFAWIIPYSIFVIVVGLAYIPFLLKLPAKVKKLMVLSGAIFVAGALGLEAIESYYFSATGGKRDFMQAIFTTTEEIMEMGGITIFLYSLLHYIELEFGGVSIRITAKAEHSVVADKPAKKIPANAATKTQLS